MRILVIFTGGTIGSTVQGEYISPDADKPYIILEEYKRLYPDDTQWDTVTPYTVLSENITGRTYEQLLCAVREGLAAEASYDGIIITHGSDTLQYSAAFLSMVLGKPDVPVMLVSSNYVLEDSRANGMENFRCSVDFIRNGYGKGVFIPYRNAGENCKIHAAGRAMPHSLYSDRLESIGGRCFGEYGERGFEYLSDYPEEEVLVPDRDFYSEGSGIMQLHACPGLEYPVMGDNIKAVLLHAYHSGTLCVESDGLKAFMTEAAYRKIPVYLVGKNPETDYESCSRYEALGIRVLPEVSPVYAYMRLWILKGKWV